MGSFFISGKPGSGKTTLACSMVKLGYRVLLIDLDGKARTMYNLKPWIEDGSIEVIELESEMSESSLKQVALGGAKYFPKKQPQGYVEFTEIIDGLKDDPPEDHDRVVPVIDSMTRVNEHLKRLIKFFVKKPKLDFDGWDAVLNNYEELFTTFFKLQPKIYPHCIVTAHIRDDYDESGALVQYKPLIDGQFREKAAGYVDEAYYCEVAATNRNQPAKFMVYTKPIGLIKHARSSRPMKTYVEADMEVLLSDLALGEETEEEEEEE